MGAKIRDTYWDSLKFVLIYLVVLGHTLEMWIPDGSFNRALYNTIYLFHMPLFIFISGRFSHINDRKKYKQGIIKLLETFLVFQILRSLVLPLLLGEALNWKYIVVPNWILWYLVALIWWWLLVLCTPITTLLEHRRKIIMGSIMICIFAGFIPIGHPLELQRTLVFLPFFVFGYYSNDIDYKYALSKIPKLMALIFFVIVFTLFYFVLNFNLSWLLSAGQHFWETTPPMWVRLVSRLIYLPCAFCALLLFMRLIEPNQWFSKWGGETMLIYIYHPYILDVIKYFVGEGKIETAGVALHLYAFGVILILLQLSKHEFFMKLLNPISQLYTKALNATNNANR